MATNQWMANPVVQNKQIGQIVLPGTHDTATYSLTDTLSQVKYPNIDFLWELSSERAPKGFPGGAPFHVGPELYHFIFQVIKNVSQAQNQTALAQLNDGIRFFDLRVYYDTDAKDLYLQHALRACPLSDILKDIASFLAQEGGKELILLQISHTNFQSGNEPDGATRLAEELNKYIDAASFYVPSDLKTFAATPLSQITGQGSRVLVINADGDVKYPKNVPIFSSTDFYQTAGGGADGTDDVNTLIDTQDKGLKKERTSPLYEISWTLTPQVIDIANEVASQLAGNPSNLVLKTLADKANARLQGFIDAHASDSFNLITVDWYQNSPVVDIAIAVSSR